MKNHEKLALAKIALRNHFPTNLKYFWFKGLKVTKRDFMGG